ncbi:hypothetical protein fugu_014190 [Takifugu bimaculatus]|uniref:Uncharacterized protein n=1 Tax=Takifugu bimaculatus TaxID=433685 RepID=A0A4Z2C0P1_9TELE|nr:hypothetical protein fugu_014190 [Takifugu bimaculatus]
MDPRPLLLACALVLGAAFRPSEVNDVSQCKVKWLFGISCSEVSERLVGQIQAWQIKESCQDAGESCSYELVSTSTYLVTATHTSPVTRKVSNLQFLLEQSTVCKMTGEAASELTKPPDDKNPNYCSLQNLIDGSDLNSAEGYKQVQQQVDLSWV